MLNCYVVVAVLFLSLKCECAKISPQKNYCFVSEKDGIQPSGASACVALELNILFLVKLEYSRCSNSNYS